MLVMQEEMQGQVAGGEGYCPPDKHDIPRGRERERGAEEGLQQFLRKL